MRPDDYHHRLLLLFLLLLLPLRQLSKEAVYTRVSLARRTHIARDCGGNHGYEKVSTCLCSGCVGRSREEESLSRACSVWKNLGKRKFTGEKSFCPELSLNQQNDEDVGSSLYYRPDTGIRKGKYFATG